jgi:hypothetical protein
MTRIFCLTMLLCLLATNGSAAEFYKCQGKRGEVVFQAKPCQGGVVVKTHNDEPSSAPPAPADPTVAGGAGPNVATPTAPPVEQKTTETTRSA